jgi:transaldolase/glucose-6-phosphate isomerase
MNSLKELQRHGQSVWLDYIRRSLITNGELKRMIEEDGLSGVTINPTIFEKAIAGSDDYDESLKKLLKEDPHMDARKLYEKLAVEDVQMTADILRPVYEKTRGADGYVSLELSPDLANDTEGSIKEAHYFWRCVNRPNLLLKVPATPEGVPVVEKLISEGINVNITLMFSLSHYEAVSSAYINGLEKLKDPSRVASVASFFVSRVETIVDKALEEKGTSEALKLRGRIAVANSKKAYQRFKEVFSGERWNRLKKRGARVQRILWASTGTKNPEYSDVLYVEELIGTDTVNTLPPATLNAFRDHGEVRAALEERIEEAEAQIKKLTELGIDLDELTEKLQVEGVIKFAESYNKLISALEEKRKAILKGQLERQALQLERYQNLVNERIKIWGKMDFNRRLWEKDPTLWLQKPTKEISDRLGWLILPEMMHEQLEDLVSFSEEVSKEGIKHIILLGMGGSSLAPEVYQNTFGNAPGHPELIVLDSTHPGAVLEIQQKIDIPRTLFIVASKSGTTLEPNAFFNYFWIEVKKAVKTPGHHFIAITDPGTPLMKLAEEKSFRRIFQAPSDLGGRYSALTVFGMVPAALIGVDVHRLIDRAWAAAEGCAFCVPVPKVPGLVLGAALGEVALKGLNKLTFLSSPAITNFPNWIEQLVAESTGKEGRGIFPVVNEPFQDKYGRDRFFVYYSLEGDKSDELEERVKALEAAGHPTARITLSDNYDIGLEIFRWEIAVASAGAVLGINPFNQPDVELAKELARQAMKGETKEDAAMAETVNVEDNEALTAAFKEWISAAKEGYYVAIQAYLQPTPKTTRSLQMIREKLAKKTLLATALGYGPRFLHSTGQLHKGGPNTGLFLQLIDEPEENLMIPEKDYSFGDIIRAQALGDYQALKKSGRRVLRINLKKDVNAGLSHIAKNLPGDV